MTFTVGLVVEGVTDLPIIERLVTHHLNAAGIEDVSFDHLQPEYDATSGGWSEGGYSCVRAWCEGHDPETRAGKFLRPLFAGDTACDALLIHLDGDIAEQFAVEVGLPTHARSPSPLQRGEVIGRLIERWLWPDGNPRLEEALHVPIAAIQATETWIIAGSSPTARHPETVDPVPALIALSPGLEDPRAPGRLKAKTPKQWRRLCRQHVVGNEASIIARCPHLRAALEALRAIAV